MSALTAFGIGLKTLMLWVCYLAIAFLLGFAAVQFWGIPTGLLVYAGAWIVPTTVYWAYLTFRSFYDDEKGNR